MRASICPVMVVENLPYLLLGRSRSIKSWAEGSSVWDDFGGMGEDVEETAARELYEETLGTLITKSDIPVLAQSLREEQYVMKYMGDGVIFLVKFNWNPKVLYDFSKLRFQLKCFEKICAGFPLFTQERLEMCKFKWMQCDSKLKNLLAHPAIEKSKRYLPGSVIENAHKSLSKAIHSSSTAYSKGCDTVIVHGVKKQFMEKEVIELFGIAQLCCCFQEEGLCVEGQSIQLSSSFLVFLPVLKKFLIGF